MTHTEESSISETRCIVLQHPKYSRTLAFPPMVIFYFFNSPPPFNRGPGCFYDLLCCGKHCCGAETTVQMVAPFFIILSTPQRSQKIH